MPRRRAALLASAGALLFALAQPPFGLWPLAFGALLPVYCALEGRGPASRAALGALAGALAGGLTTLQPLSVAMSEYFERSLWWGAAVGLGIGPGFGAAGFALFAVLGGDPARQPRVSLLLRLPAACVAGELLRARMLTGLPWTLLGHALAPAPALAQLASLAGTWGVSFWLAAANGALLLMVRRETRKTGAVGGLVLVVIALLAGAWGRFESTPRGEQKLSVAVVQPATPRDWRLDPRRVAENLAGLRALTERAGGVDLVVWPENALGVLFPENAGLLHGAARGSALLVGGHRSAPGGKILNSALLFDAGGAFSDAHDKVRLVPFTEYVPAPLVSLGFTPGRTLAGERPRVLELGPHRLGALVCYEMLFPELSRQLVAAGAEVLFNLSNDEWFGTSGGAEQHLSAAVLRAIELRRPVLRSTMSGISVAIDPSGVVAERLEGDEPGVFVIDVAPGRVRTLYARTGDAWAWGFAALALLLALPRRGKSRKTG